MIIYLLFFKFLVFQQRTKIGKNFCNSKNGEKSPSIAEKSLLLPIVLNEVTGLLRFSQ